MTVITLPKLRSAMAAESLILDEDQEKKLLRAWRKLNNPDGCPDCEQHVLVGVMKGKRLVSACCGSRIG